MEVWGENIDMNTKGREFKGVYLIHLAPDWVQLVL
jgi:hypothetical protein